MKRILISACETSGEAHATLLVRVLKERYPTVDVDVVGSSAMVRTEANVVETLEADSVMGLAEGMRAIPAHLRLFSRLRKRFAAGFYDLVVLIDYPGFHLKVAAAAAARGIPVLYYIAPQLWAWGSWRIRKLRKNVRQMAVVLPFEEEYFRSRGVVADFVGHPLLDRPKRPTAAEARESLGLSAGTLTLGLLPGSRPTEIHRIWPRFRDAAKVLAAANPGLRILVAAMDGVEYEGAPEFQFCRDNSSRVLAASDALLCKSGTATLEAALSETPMVIGYVVHPFTYAVARYAVQVSHVGLVNLVAGREVCPELLQGKATPQALAAAVAPLLDADSTAATLQREAFMEISARLGGSGATEKVASIVDRMVA